MYKYISILIKVLLVIMVIDFLGFISWSLSDSKPIDNFYAGVITTKIIRVIIK